MNEIDYIFNIVWILILEKASPKHKKKLKSYLLDRISDLQAYFLMFSEESYKSIHVTNHRLPTKHFPLPWNGHHNNESLR